MAVATLVTNLIAKTSVFDKAMRRSRKRLTGFQRGVQAINAKLAVLSTVAATAGIAVVGLSTKAFANFEKQMANVSTMLDEPNMKWMVAYTKGIKKMAVEFGESTETLTKGLYDILSASVAPSMAMGVLAVSAKAAKAGMTSTAIAADAITTILNSYQMSADQAAQVSDVLFAIVKRGKTTFAELAPNIGKVAAIASVAGLSFEEVGAALATMTRAGLQSDLATTSLRSIINSFLKPTKDSAEAARVLGIELNTTTLHTEGLTGILQKLSGASAEQLAQIIPNVRGLAGFAASMKQASGQARDLQLMLNSAGMTQKAFEKTTATTAHTLNQVKQMIKMTGVNIGSFLSPVIKGASEKFLSLSNSLIDLRNTFAKTFPNMTFFLKNFGKFMEYAMITSIYHIVKFANQTVYFFTEVIPATLIWFRDQWKNIFQTIWDFTRSVFVNMGKNLASFFKAVVAALQGKGWNFEWTALTEGFESSIEKLPEIAKRKIGVYEMALQMQRENILLELGKKYNQYMDQWSKLSQDNLDAINQSTKKTQTTIENIINGKAKEPGWGKEIDKSLISIAGLAIGTQNPILNKLDEGNKLSREHADYLRKIANEGGLM